MIDRKTLDRSRISIVANLTPTGTDPQAFNNFFIPMRPSGKLNGAFANLISDPKIAATSLADPVLSNVVIGVILGDLEVGPARQAQGGRSSDHEALLPRDVTEIKAVYKGASARRDLGDGPLPAQRLGADARRPAQAARRATKIVQYWHPSL